MGKDNHDKGIGGLEGILRGFTDLIDKVGELADKGDVLKQSGIVHGKDKDLKGVYGFSIKTCLNPKEGQEGIKVEPFGNIRRDEKTGESVVREIQEPIVDIFEEEDHILVVAETPGIGKEDVHIEVNGDLLIFWGERGEKKYRKEILLPRACEKEGMEVFCNNGILEIKCHF